MKLSDRKLGSSDVTAANAGVPASNFAVPATLPEPGSVEVRRNHLARRISDRQLALVQVCCDFLCACIALPLSLLLLSAVSHVEVNSLHKLGTNLTDDCIFPFAAIAALALGGMYRVTHRKLQPSA